MNPEKLSEDFGGQIAFHGGIDVQKFMQQATPELVKDKVTAVVCLGKDNEKIKEAFSGTVGVIAEAATALEAVALGYQLAKKEQTVLLSPACASFDLFESYEDRGAQFKSAVRAL